MENQLLIRETLVVGSLQCNCTLLACAKTKEAVLIDPGDDAAEIARMVERAGVKVRYLLHTHAHFDHIGATEKIHRQFGGTTCLHAGDQDLWNNLPLQGQFFGMRFDPISAAQKLVTDEEEITFGEHRLRVIHTPGHSPGSICFQLQGEDAAVYSGDTLFHQSVGRADLWGGDAHQLIRSIQHRLLPLAPETPVHPGHGPSTTIGHEKRHNPFLS